MSETIEPTPAPRCHAGEHELKTCAVCGGAVCCDAWRRLSLGLACQCIEPRARSPSSRSTP